MVVGMEKDMYKAAISGDVNYFSDGKKDLHQKTPQGNNILHLAAEFKKINIFKDVHQFLGGSDKRSPLFWAVNKMGDTPMHIAARVGCAEVVDFLIERAKELYVRKACDLERGTPCAESYRKLLRKINSEKHTALHVAARYGHGQVVNSLMKADPKLCSSDYSAKESPLFLATCKGFSNIALDILKEPSASFRGIRGVTALHAAVTHTYEGAEEIVKNMVSKDPDAIKKKDDLGWTPLHYAAFRGNLKAIKLLMNSDKSTCYMLDKCGMSALHIAAYKGHIEVMEELMQCRPDTCECLNAKDQTILHVAVLGAQSRVVEYILKLPEITRLIVRADKEGHTPLHLSVISPNPEITTMMKPYCRSVDNNAIDKGFALVFDSFLGEDIKIQTASALGNGENEDPTLLPYNKAEQEGSLVILGKGSDKLENITDTSHQGLSFGVPLFQEQISRDFKKFKVHPKNQRKNEQSNTNLVIATLIATVTFAAALAPPGGYGNDGKLILRDDTKFRWFQTFNFVSFLFSLLVLLYESVVTVAAFLGPLISKIIYLFKPESLCLVSLYGMLLAILMGTAAGQPRPKKTSDDLWMNLATVVMVFIAMAPALKQQYRLYRRLAEIILEK